MASHKQSFQCFDTIMDDPSLKPPFPHGHCSSASFRGSSVSTRLEPLEDRGCYLCADHQQAKAMASEASGAYSNPWYHFQTHPHSQQYTIRRPTRAEEAPGQVEGHHHHHWHSRKIVLVKNSDPSVRRTIVLHRRSLRSLVLFMDEVSELMQCLIRKLYTLEGHKIDSVHSLLQCPSILVCVGREPFHPLLLDSFRKNSYDKLPRLNTKPRSSVCSDEKWAKKNVNFGLETKRNAIHPRCDSSNRSAGLSISSEMLFPNGLNSLPPGHRGACPQTGENTMDDDIEKRVLVNKDGSLSMEMKVRFRLLHNETLHWSTEVKKSKSTFNESHIVHDDACSLSHGSAESCSEADSLSAGEADETYSTKRYQRHFEEPHCQHCCTHCQEYDIWKNPVPPDQESVRRIRSSSSSASSRRIVCKKASTDSMRTMSSEEYTEHVVEKATCIQQTFGQQGDTTIEQCTINHCRSRSEVRSMSPKTKSTSTVEDKRENTHVSENDEKRPDVISSNLPKDQLSVQITQPMEEEERPVSVVSSSQILASLKEDQDDEDVDLPSSITRTSHGQQEDEESKVAEPNPCSTTPCKSPASPAYLSPRPPSTASSLGLSKRSRKLASPEVDDEEGRSEASASPKASSGPTNCKCVVTKDIATLGDSESNDQLEGIQPKTYVQDEEKEERALSSMSANSKTSTKSLSELSTSYENENGAECIGANGKIIVVRSSSAISIKSITSGKSNKTNVSEVLEKDGRAASAMSIKSQKSDKSRQTEFSDNVSEEQISEVRTSSAMSVKSNTSVRSKASDNGFDELPTLQDYVEERAVSALSSKSNISTTSSRSKEPQSVTDGASEERIEEKASSVKTGTSNKYGIQEVTNDDQTVERAPSSISIKSNISARSKMSIELSELEDQDRAPSSISIKSNISHKSKSDISEAVSFQERDESLNSVKLNTPETKAAPQVGLPGERSPSSVSSKSNMSTRSKTSKKSEVDQDGAQEKVDVQERASSAILVNSTTSARSRKSEKTPKLGEETKERAPSVTSIKSNASLKSNKSKMEEEEIENRASSTLSVKSEVSTLSKKSNVSVRSKGSKMSEVAGDDNRSSAVYAASHTSETSNEISTAPKETCKSTEKSPDKEKRALSALSTKSTNSKKSKVSDMADDIVDEDRDDLRSVSAMSSKSNVSAKSVKSVISELVTEEALDQTEERAQSALAAQSNQSGVTVSDGVEVAEEWALSAMSSKSNASERLKKSSNLKVPTALPQAAKHQPEERTQSTLSARSSISTRSNKSKTSDVLTDMQVDVKDQKQKRASSALSAKSSISAKSKNSNISATDVKADEKGDRIPSAMSGRSAISTKTSISAKSKASQVSEVPPEETDDEESEVKAPSITKSSISVRSNKSNHSDFSAEEGVQNIERPPSAISIISDATPDENEITNDDEIQERAPSAVSAKSHSSVRSRTSKVSEIIIDEPDKQNVERAPSSRSLKSDASGRSGPGDPVNKEKEARTESGLSSISVRSKKSEDSEINNNVEQIASSTASVTSTTSARSKRSNISVVAPKEIGKTDTEDVRASSAMSAKSCTSEKSKCSERTVEKDEEASKVVDRTSSSLSAKSNQSITSDATVKSSVVPTKSNASAKSLLSEAEEPDRRSTSVVSNASADSKMSEAGVYTKANRSPSKLSVKSNVSTRSKKSKISEGEDHTPTNTEDRELNRDESPLSNHSEVSQAENSNECICGAINKPSSPVASSEKDSDHEEVPASPLSKKSAKSKISSVGSASERVLTPTSTSVSIGVVEDHEADDVSINSRISASSKTEICGKSDQGSSESPVQITNEATPTPEGRPKSSTTANSNVSRKLRSKSSHCGSACPTDTIQDRDDVASNKSSKITYSIISSDSQPSANSSVKQSSQTQKICPSSKASGMSVHTEITGQEKAESPYVTKVSHKSQSVCSKCSSTQQKGKMSPALSASAISDSEKSKTKEGNTAEMTDRPKSKISNPSSHLKVNGQNNFETTVVNERSNKSNTMSTQKVEDNATRLSVTSGNHLSPSPPKSPKKSKKPVILLGSSNDSVLLQTVPAPEPREEYTDHLNAAAERPQSCRSDTNVSEIKSEKSSKCRKRIGSNSSCHKMNDDMSEPSPSRLPNASPTEVVNEWLRKIPSDTTLCDLGDEFHDNYVSIEPLCTSDVPSGVDNEHGSLQPRDVTKLETQNEMEGAHVVSTEGATDKKSPEVAEGDHSQRGDEPKMFSSSVLVMKVLLTPKLDRCNSLPEVSPVYGRKLSASVQGLLDCLANLQLLDFGPSDEDGKKEKYQELTSMLKSLWLCDPKDNEKTSVERNKRLDEEFKARSSSGVDVNSGSTGSGKSSINDGIQAQINTECEGLDTLTKVLEVDETVEGEASETKYDSATPDIASQAQWTPETKGTIEVKLKDDVPGSEETIRSNDSPRELIETPLSSNKSSGNNPKKEETESDRQEDTSSGSAPKHQKGQLSKRLSQDPDPVWVLNLLNKLEKQFMTHYINAMAEFKVRWNLDDNEQLDAMICELQDEVRRRIQSSIDRELRKIQGRAERPRPPKDTMSRESTIQTVQRRRRLKVMRNQSIDPQPAKSDDDYTMTWTDFSDQHSDDEYCPCDTCLKKKMVSKHVLPVEMFNSAPVMKDFDLRRILQMKKSSPTSEKIEETANEEASELEIENAGLKAVKEEDEKEGADKEILASSAQEIEDEKRESEEGEENDSASSTYVEDSSENQSNILRHLKKDVNEVGEIAEMSFNTMMMQQDEEQEENIEIDSDLTAVKESASSSKINELDEDVANYDISEFDDIMQTEAAKEEATEEHTEEESEQQDKTDDDETAEEGQTAKTESVKEGETTGEETSEDGQTAETVAVGEDDVAGCDTAEEGETAEGEKAEDAQIAEAKTSRDGETAEDESAEAGETTEDKASEDGQISDEETTAENGQTSEGETGEDGETGNGDTAEEHETAESETAEEGQTAEDETGKEGETVNDDTTEEHETAESETAEEGQTTEDETGEEGETVIDDTAEEHEMAENETVEERQTAEDETGEEGETINNDTTEEHETAERSNFRRWTNC
ncbi:retinitis pigmentosa 1-like 1 protein isoform X2 [Sinocyclocheilus grahami]|uniref:retinitis pigmentosa 1-like 1 protein isoform X2 n=1 Tax=Sinocyclocheilus grahami TaxID=75366 RepID=UPI0007AC809D|nr:PREDICTED: retinitis pigmentosa 1-like 1 protein isoform X2 [Sinocyclocheilus grahami]